MPTFNYDIEHPIFRLAYEGRLDELQKMIHEDKTLAQQCASNGSSLIHFAAEAGHVDMLQWLLDKENNFNIPDKMDDGFNALIFASFKGHLDAVKWLITEGGSQATEEDNDGLTALHYAAFNGHLHILKWFLSPEGGSQLSEKNNSGSTALHLAAINGHLDTVHFLLSHPSMTYKKFEAVQAKDNLHEEARKLIDEKMKDYESFIRKADKEEDIKGLFQVTDQSITIANELFCPISLTLIEDPVIASDGVLYEKQNIEKWLKASDTSPKTNLPLDSDKLYPAQAIKICLNDIEDAIETLYQNRQAQKAALLEPRPKTSIKRAMSEPSLGAFFKKAPEHSETLYHALTKAAETAESASASHAA